MDENAWKFAQIVMWIVGIQTTLILAIISGLWISICKNNEKIDKLDEKVTDIDRRLCRVEGMLTTKECCRLTHEEKLKKVD